MQEKEKENWRVLAGKKTTANLTPEELSERGRKGGKIGGKFGGKIGGKKAAENMTPEERRERAKKGGQIGGKIGGKALKSEYTKITKSPYNPCPIFFPKTFISDYTDRRKISAAITSKILPAVEKMERGEIPLPYTWRERERFRLILAELPKMRVSIHKHLADRIDALTGNRNDRAIFILAILGFFKNRF